MEIENTLKKMGLVIEKLAGKVDELDKRVSKLEEKELKGEKRFSSEDFQNQSQINSAKTVNSSKFSGGFGSGFLGSLTGSMAGMGLYHLLFDYSVTPENFGESLGMDKNEINETIDNDFDNIDERLDEIDNKLDEIDQKLDEENSDNSDDIMDNDYYESYENNLPDNDFDSGFDDFDGIEDV
jgi:peptidoglycan hydrolase CwlO-like protein